MGWRSVEVGQDAGPVRRQESRVLQLGPLLVPLPSHSQLILHDFVLSLPRGSSSSSSSSEDFEEYEYGNEYEYGEEGEYGLGRRGEPGRGRGEGAGGNNGRGSRGNNGIGKSKGLPPGLSLSPLFLLVPLPKWWTIWVQNEAGSRPHPGTSYNWLFSIVELRNGHMAREGKGNNGRRAGGEPQRPGNRGRGKGLSKERAGSSAPSSRESAQGGSQFVPFNVPASSRFVALRGRRRATMGGEREASGRVRVTAAEARAWPSLPLRVANRPSADHSGFLSVSRCAHDGQRQGGEGRETARIGPALGCR